MILILIMHTVNLFEIILCVSLPFTKSSIMKEILVIYASIYVHIFILCVRVCVYIVVSPYLTIYLKS